MAFFELIATDKKTGARRGRITTDHGVVETPAFMTVGTQGSVKTLDSADLKALGAPIILGNTYHLHLRPGEDIIAAHQGLHRFMSWDKPILTDSGGFQVFSLGFQKEKNPRNRSNEKLVTITDDGVTFRSHLDGSLHTFTPESAILAQHKIGADIIMAFDECTPDDAPESYVREAMQRTHAWAKRSLTAHQENTNYHGYRQFLFGIIQGAKSKKLRQESARAIAELNFDGIAVGGESIGYNMEATADILDWVMPLIPENKPHYAMGIGLNPMDLLAAVEHGVDMFDCVAPTRLARHGMMLVFDPENNHRLNIKNASYKTDQRPIDETCDCPTCRAYSRSYLHHLFQAEEITALRLATLHNVRFMLKLMEDAREAIETNAFTDLKKHWILR